MRTIALAILGSLFAVVDHANGWLVLHELVARVVGS